VDAALYQAKAEGHTHRASKDDPQYEIQSDRTSHVAAHKGSALHKTAR